LFDVIINPIIEHVKTLLSNENLKNKPVKYICLAGGLSESKYFQHRIKETFGEKDYKLTIIIPKRPILSVIDGAARYGFVQKYVIARCLRKTYGISISVPLEYARQYNFDQAHIDKYKFERNNQIWVNYAFSVFKRKEDIVYIDDKPKIREYQRYAKNQSYMCIQVFATYNKDPKMIDEKM